MPLKPQTPAWFDRLATLQEGYYYPWRSRLPPWHGEDAFRDMVNAHLRPDADLLEVACGHGALALEIAPRVRSVVAYDRTAPWIALAERAARERGIANATFLCRDSSIEANDGRARIPADDRSFDLIVCSKGPFHWIEDAARVARPGAALLMLVPDNWPHPPWIDLLPEPLRWQPSSNPAWARPAVEARLAAGGLSLESWWSFDVPELFPDPEQLYVWLTWGKTPDEVPSLAQLRPAFERLFAEHGQPGGVTLRYRRYIWRATVPA